MTKDTIYRPLTATPFRHSSSYREFLPSPPLAPYIRCFWCGTYPASSAGADLLSTIVIPDTCADIIFQIDHTDQRVHAGFCGVSDQCMFSYGGMEGHEISLFAIRFYAWSAYLFSEDSLEGTLNGYSDIGERFHWLEDALRGRLTDHFSPIDPFSLTELIRYTERLLLKRLEDARHHAVTEDAVSCLLLHRGACGISRLAKECFVSTRQLERLFHEYIGVTPGKLARLIRYQCLWQDIVYLPDFDIQDAVFRYGYTDQAHLMREFKRCHSMSIRCAKQLAGSCR